MIFTNAWLSLIKKTMNKNAWVILKEFLRSDQRDEMNLNFKNECVELVHSINDNKHPRSLGSSPPKET